MARGDQLARQWTIIQSLQADLNGKSVSDLAADLERVLVIAPRIAVLIQSGSDKAQVVERVGDPVRVADLLIEA